MESISRAFTQQLTLCLGEKVMEFINILASSVRVEMCRECFGELRFSSTLVLFRRSKIYLGRKGVVFPSFTAPKSHRVVASPIC